MSTGIENQEVKAISGAKLQFVGHFKLPIYHVHCLFCLWHTTNWVWSNIWR